MKRSNRYDFTLDILGSMTVAGGLSLSDSSLSLHDWAEAAKSKAQTLTVKGDLSEGNSSISLSGALSAANLSLTGGADITLTSTKWQTIKVSKSLTLSGMNELHLNYAATEKDVTKGTIYKLFTLKTTNLLEDADLYSLLGMDDDYCSLRLDTARAATGCAPELRVRAQRARYAARLRWHAVPAHRLRHA